MNLSNSDFLESFSRSKNVKKHSDVKDGSKVMNGCTSVLQSIENTEGRKPHDDFLCREESFPFKESKTHQEIRESYGDSIKNTRIRYPMEKIYSDVGEFQLEEIIAAKRKTRAKKHATSKTFALQSQHDENVAPETGALQKKIKENVMPKTDFVQRHHEESYKALKKEKERAEEKFLTRQNQLSEVLKVLNSKLGINMQDNSDEMINVGNVCAQLMKLDANKIPQSPVANVEDTSVWETNDSNKNNSLQHDFHTTASDSGNSFCSSHILGELASSSRCKLGLPSPTVYTKEALGSIEDMFKKPLDAEAASDTNAFLCNNMKTSQLSLLFDTFGNQFKGNTFDCDKMQDFNENKPNSFQIFCDDPPKQEIGNVNSALANEHKTSKNNALGFQIFCDELSGQKINEPVSNINNPPAFSIFCDEPSRQDTKSSQMPSYKLPETNSKSFKIFGDKQSASNQNFEIFSDVSINEDEFCDYSRSEKKVGQVAENVPVSKCNIPNFDEMSETIVTGERNCSDITFQGKEDDFGSSGLEGGILAESTSYKQLSCKNKSIENELKENAQQSDGTKKSQKLSPILETSEDYEGAKIMKDYEGCESLYPNKCSLTNLTSEETDFPSLSSIGFALKHSIPNHSSLNSSNVTKRAEKSYSVEKVPNHTNDTNILSKFCSSAIADTAVNYSHISSGISLPRLNIIDDPWDESILRQNVLSCISQCKKILTFSYKSPVFRKSSRLEISGQPFGVLDIIGQGGFAKVYHVTSENNQSHAIKVESPPCKWEIVVTELVKQRLEAFRHPLVHKLLIDIEFAVIFTDASWLVTEYVAHGTLLDFVNNTAKTIKISPLQYHQLALQVLLLVDALHAVDIIHGDIKPDNFLMCSDYKTSTSLKVVPELRLIDFGRAIDMKSFPSNTAFLRSCGTSAFVCTQMKEGSPWNYHTDYYGIAGTVFLLLTNSYMKVMKIEEDGLWKPTNKLPRWTSFLWTDLISTLLNYPCPDKQACSYQTSPLPGLIKKLQSAIKLLKE